MAKKSQMVALILAISLFLPGMSSAKNKKMDDDGGNAAFTISSVSPDEFSPEQETAVTITGTGFSDGLKVGIAEEDDAVTSVSGLTVLSSAYASCSQLTAIVPAGFTAGEYDLYVYDPSQSSFHYAVKEEALELQVESSSNISELGYSNSNAARRKVEVRFDGITLTKKKWVKVRMNGKNVPILKLVRNDGNSTTLRLNVKYKGWAPGSYALAMTYKNRMRVQYTNSKGKVKYRNGWETGTMTVENFLTII